MSVHSQDNKPGFGFKLFKAYIRFFHGKIFYKKTYWLHTERIPAEGPLMVVSDHQNGLSDVLGVLMSIDRRRDKRKVRVVARADVFKPAVRKALHWLGLIPAYRLAFDGEASLSNNAASFEDIEQELLLDGTVVIYPEAGHQDKHWLGQFSLAYLHILFEAARKTGFQKEMFVLPSCNHYSDYFHAREKMLVCYGTPISLAPYYELYQTRPRTAQRQVNLLVRQQISSMMLNITDLEHYAAIDFMRETYGIDYARRKGLDPDNLPQKLEADKMLVKRLDEAKAADEETVAALYTAVDRFRQQLDALRVADHAFRRPGSAGLLAAKGAGFALLFPVFAVACVPNLLVYYAPTLITKRVKDRFLHSGFDFGVSALLSVPVLYTLTCGIVWSATQSLWIALICLGGLPLMGIFMYFYMKKFKAYKVQLRFHRLRRKGLLGDLAEQRAWIHSTIDNILKQFS